MKLNCLLCVWLNVSHMRAQFVSLDGECVCVCVYHSMQCDTERDWRRLNPSKNTKFADDEKLSAAQTNVMISDGVFFSTSYWSRRHSIQISASQISDFCIFSIFDRLVVFSFSFWNCRRDKNKCLRANVVLVGKSNVFLQIWHWHIESHWIYPSSAFHQCVSMCFYAPRTDFECQIIE